MDSLIFHLILTHRPIVYVLIYFGLALEGEAVVFLAFFLVHQKILHLSLVFSVSILGMLTGDSLWFLFGNYLEKFSWIRKNLQKLLPIIDRQIEKNAARAIFVSKFTYGFHRYTLMRAGAKGVNYFQFLLADLLATILWTIIFGSLGYFLSASLSILKRDVKFVEISLLLVGGVIVFFIKFLSKKNIKRDEPPLPLAD